MNRNQSNQMANPTLKTKMGSWYRPPDDTLEELENFGPSFREQIDKIRNKYKGNKPPSVHVQGDSVSEILFGLIELANLAHL